VTLKTLYRDTLLNWCVSGAQFIQQFLRVRQVRAEFAINEKLLLPRHKAVGYGNSTRGQSIVAERVGVHEIHVEAGMNSVKPLNG